MKARSLPVRCIRCGGERYILPEHLPPAGYVCLRCRGVPAGRNVLDPLTPDVSAGQAAYLARARAARQASSDREIPQAEQLPMVDPSPCLTSRQKPNVRLW